MKIAFIMVSLELDHCLHEWFYIIPACEEFHKVTPINLCLSKKEWECTYSLKLPYEILLSGAYSIDRKYLGYTNFSTFITFQNEMLQVAQSPEIQLT